MCAISTTSELEVAVEGQFYILQYYSEVIIDITVYFYNVRQHTSF